MELKSEKSDRLSGAALRAIEALADKATPGPWVCDAGYGIYSAKTPRYVARMEGDVVGANDAMFIAALSPDVVLALVAAARERTCGTCLYRPAVAVDANIDEAICLKLGHSWKRDESCSKWEQR